MLRLVAVLLFAVLAGIPQFASADKLLIERIGNESGMSLPSRGMSMAQVERKFGAPASRMEPRGGQKRQWPTINRWTYPNFVVYFERDKVIDVVAIRAGNEEIGPKAPIR